MLMETKARVSLIPKLNSIKLLPLLKWSSPLHWTPCQSLLEFHLPWFGKPGGYYY